MTNFIHKPLTVILLLVLNQWLPVIPCTTSQNILLGSNEFYNALALTPPSNKSKRLLERGYIGAASRYMKAVYRSQRRLFRQEGVGRRDVNRATRSSGLIGNLVKGNSIKNGCAALRLGTSINDMFATISQCTTTICAPRTNKTCSTSCTDSGAVLVNGVIIPGTTMMSTTISSPTSASASASASATVTSRSTITNSISTTPSVLPPSAASLIQPPLPATTKPSLPEVTIAQEAKPTELVPPPIEVPIGTGIAATKVLPPATDGGLNLTPPQ